MTHKGAITLETERLILRRFSLDDAEAMFCNSLRDPKVPTYMTWMVYDNIESVLKRLVCFFFDEINALDDLDVPNCCAVG